VSKTTIDLLKNKKKEGHDETEKTSNLDNKHRKTTARGTTQLSP